MLTPQGRLNVQQAVSKAQKRKNCVPRNSCEDECKQEAVDPSMLFGDIDILKLSNGFRFITDGNGHTKYLYPGEELPEGWVFGRHWNPGMYKQKVTSDE